MRRRRRAVDAVFEDQAIQAGRPEPGDVDLLRTAIELRSADPGAGVPREEFVDSLRDRLAAELDAGSSTASAAPVEIRRVPRRALLAGAGAVAAGVAGVMLDRTLLGGSGNGETPEAAGPSAEIEPIAGTWVPVAPAAALADGGAQRFSTPTVVGFVSQEGNELRAVSGACTHQGCLLKLNVDAGRLDCPCHRTAFALDGRTLFHQLAAAPAPLPHLKARRAGDQIEVFVPTERT
ncbi:MAG TPA: Rieske (2Fe-2S) protein [Acidimicrobiia bacterium]|jgi:Rieske Fe-S protein